MQDGLPDLDAINASIPTDAMARSTVAMVCCVDKRARQMGSATLCCIADHYFLITARHVAEKGQALGRTTGITADNQQFVSIIGDWVFSSGPFEACDLAVFRLRTE